MSNTKGNPEFSRMDALKEHISSAETASIISSIVKPGGRFKIVPKRESMILPDVGYEKGWLKRQTDLVRAVGSGEGWKSSA
jgi:hypothetical protein